MKTLFKSKHRKMPNKKIRYRSFILELLWVKLGRVGASLKTCLLSHRSCTLSCGLKVVQYPRFASGKLDPSSRPCHQKAGGSWTVPLVIILLPLQSNSALSPVCHMKACLKVKMYKNSNTDNSDNSLDSWSSYRHSSKPLHELTHAVFTATLKAWSLLCCPSDR